MVFKTRVVKGGIMIVDSRWKCEDHLIIPENIKGKRVVSIGNFFLYHNELLRSIVLPNSIKSIGNSFLSHNNSLEYIILPNSLESIGDDFLGVNNSLESIVLPKSVKSIGNGFLYFDRSLKKITMKNKIYKTRFVDGYMVIILSKYKRDDYTIMKARFLHNMSSCYVVKKDRRHACGKTIKKAIKDLDFKILRKTTSALKLAKDIKKK